MALVTHRSPRWGARPRGLHAVAVLAAILAVSFGGAAWAQAPQVPSADGMFITVPNPITEDAVKGIELKVETALAQHRRIAKIVFDFNPNDAPSSSSNLSCIALADYVLDLSRIRHISTYAFVHHDVKGHAVLPVLACGELYMSDRAHIGDVLPHVPTLSTSTIAAYQDVAKKKGGAGDLVLRMIFPEWEIHQVKTRGGSRLYVEKKKLDKLLQEKDQGGVVEDQGVPAALEGHSAAFSASQARTFELCKRIYETREDVRRALALPPRSMVEDYFAGKTRIAWRIEVRGTINRAKLDSLKRRIKNAIKENANLLILQLETEGGETVDAATFAQELRNQKDNSGTMPVTTVAYIPPGKELGAATYLALGCSRIVMDENSALGNFDYLKAQSPESLIAKREMLVRLAEERGYPADLFRAMLDPNISLCRVHGKTDPDDVRIVTREVLQRDAEARDPRWVEDEGRIPKLPGEFLKLDAALASEFRVASKGTLSSVYADYNITDPSKVRVARDDWLDKVAEFFREPLVNILLVMVGIAGLILELKMPGLGLPGVIAAVCFVLFFWAHSFVGQFTMLAVLLFVLGLILIGLEIFVLPGFGVTGISGILLLVASLVLVTLERMPETTQDWLSLGGQVSVFGVSLVGAIIGAFAIAWYLPHLPYASRLVLPPPGEEDGSGEDPLAPGPDARAALLGAIGVAATTLRPAGKARFGDDFLDVVAEGDYVNPGSRVQVIEIEGNRIVVKEV